MALSTNDQGLIKEYLLGQLDDDEQQKIEERLMVEDDFFDEFEASKGELVEQYCAGELGETERDWLESHYLVSEEGKQRYLLAVALDCGKNPPRPQPIPEPIPESIEIKPAPPSWFERASMVFKRPQWMVASATAVVLVMVFGVWMIRPEGSTYVGPTLVSEAIDRGSSENGRKTFKLPDGTGKLQLRLTLPQPSTPAASYRAELDNRIEGKPVTVVASDAQTVTVEVPASLIPPGAYALILTALKSDGTDEKIPGQYYFNTY
ncbi:MAG TPA: hypothetical protein VJT15_17980 [Pyrinomonadaceae bacterium]|nr:hypothetical protein [Pyrinomonadaceae bacterium]